MTDTGKMAVHPWLIFREAWGICRKNLVKLSALYLVFYIPYLLIALLAIAIPGDQTNILNIIITLVGLWSGVTLLVAAYKASQAEKFGVGESLIGAGRYFLKYLGASFLGFITIVGVLLVTASVAIVGSALTARTSVLLSAGIQLAAVVVAISLLVYFMIRWALAGASCVLENKGPIGALKRSRELIKDYINPVVGTYLIYMVTLLLASIPYMIVLSILGDSSDGMEAEVLIGAINNIVINTILIPFLYVIMVVLYRKLKEANEANVRA
ncbi:MAG: hypothetical protein FJZ12_01145 [Candidatus Omnitrophica bacterium]|nr:hypothetical protein [Candidatus Omnitrophota bacterium]